MHAALGCGTVGHLVAALVTGPLGVSNEVVERRSFGVHHVTEALGDVVVHPAEVMLFEPLATFLGEFAQDLPQPLDPLPVGVVEPRIHHPPKRSRQVPVVEQVVGDLGHDVAGVKGEPRLGAVPSRVGVSQRSTGHAPEGTGT